MVKLLLTSAVGTVIAEAKKENVTVLDIDLFDLNEMAAEIYKFILANYPDRVRKV